MSAIWGFICPKGQPSEQKEVQALTEKMKTYQIDRVDELCQGNVYFACGHQYLTREARNERLPIYDEVHDAYFTADCILDNRSELCELLEFDDRELTDGRIVWEAYLRWGESFVERMRGTFSLAIYDHAQNKFLLYADHMSTRCINYCVKDEVIYFSTTYDLFKDESVFGKAEISQKWLTGCAVKDSPSMIVFPGLTPYESVYQVTAGQYVRINNGTVEKVQYWDPRKCKTLRLKSQNDYRNLFIQTFQSCVEDVLRPGVQVASNLSAGLDSSSVVSFAAPILAERGEVLHTYTSVPEFKDNLKYDSHYITDESEQVRKTAACFSNVECHFLACRGKSPITNLKYFVESYGFPVKSALNLMWLDELNRTARANGATVMLIGQHGNCTISYGEIFSLLYQQVMTGHWIRAIHSFQIFAKRNRVYRKRFILAGFRMWKDKMANLILPDSEPFTMCSYVKPELVEKHQIRREERKQFRLHGNGPMLSAKQRKQIPFQLDELQQMGIYSTIDSLLTGIIQRDPTKDKRLNELCCSLPMECFVSNGIERNMVRGYLRGIVPEHILKDERRRGKQGADFRERINAAWLVEKDVILNVLKRPELLEYLKEEDLREMIGKCEQTILFSEDDTMFLIHMLYVSSIGLFLDDN